MHDPRVEKGTWQWLSEYRSLSWNIVSRESCRAFQTKLMRPPKRKPKL